MKFFVGRRLATVPKSGTTNQSVRGEKKNRKVALRQSVAPDARVNKWISVKMSASAEKDVGSGSQQVFVSFDCVCLSPARLHLILLANDKTQQAIICAVKRREEMQKRI